jgi:hypothetical protein
MAKALKIGLLALVSLAIVFFGTILHIRSNSEFKEVAEFTEKFEKIRRGDLKSHVIALLGEAKEHSTEFRLGQEKGFEAAYERARQSNASYYLFRSKGLDVVYAVGFNERDEVVLAEHGGT